MQRRVTRPGISETSGEYAAPATGHPAAVSPEEWPQPALAAAAVSRRPRYRRLPPEAPAPESQRSVEARVRSHLSPFRLPMERRPREPGPPVLFPQRQPAPREVQQRRERLLSLCRGLAQPPLGPPPVPRQAAALPQRWLRALRSGLQRAWLRPVAVPRQP